jgi:hypothetical protein
MNRVGRLLICIAGGVALSVIARADVTPAAPATPNINTFRQKVDQMNRMMLLKKHHMKNLPKGFPQASPLNLSQPGAAPAVVHPNSAPAPVETEALSGNPYESIVTRNVFGLNPIPPATEVKAPTGPPPPKITLTGITTIFGPAEALFKVAGVVRDGKRQDESYIFTEGEEQDEVEVAKIDTQKHVVSFVNHGVQQDIPLSDGVASTGSAPASPTWPGLQGVRRFKRNFGGFGGNPNGFQPQSYENPNGGGNNGSQNGNNPSGAFNNNGQPSNYHNLGANISPAISGLSDDDQQALVAAAHAQAASDPNSTLPAEIFPPTKFDPEAGVPPQGGSPTPTANSR